MPQEGPDGAGPRLVRPHAELRAVLDQRPPCFTFSVWACSQGWQGEKSYPQAWDRMAVAPAARRDRRRWQVTCSGRSVHRRLGQGGWRYNARRPCGMHCGMHCGRGEGAQLLTFEIDGVKPPYGQDLLEPTAGRAGGVM